jgi:hypothetical protein
VFAGGAGSVSNLVPFFVPLGMISVSAHGKSRRGQRISHRHRQLYLALNEPLYASCRTMQLATIRPLLPTSRAVAERGQGRLPPVLIEWREAKLAILVLA